MRIGRCLVTVSGAVALVITMAVTPASGADGKDGPVGMDPITEPVPGGFRDWGEVFAMQDKLNAAADLVTAARDAGGDDGYSGIVAAPENRRLDVSWRGPLPPKVEQAIQDAKRDVPVSVAAGRYSEAELLAEADKIVAGRGVSGVAPNADGSGLTVSVTGSESDGRQIPEVRDAKVPVTIDPFVTVDPAYNRQDDSPPYWGGARYSTPIGSCTTGIPIKHQSVNRILSAGHCGENGQIAKDGGGEIMGPIMRKNATRDVLIIDTNSHSEGKVYTGGVNSNTSLPVKGAASTQVGNYVCTDGAFTGGHCPIKVQAVNQTISVSDGQTLKTFKPMVKASHSSGKVAAGLGDSGGPVINWTPIQPASGTWARGTISAVSNKLGPCEQTVCYSTVYFAGIMDTIKYFKDTVKQPISVLVYPPPPPS